MKLRIGIFAGIFFSIIGCSVYGKAPAAEELLEIRLPLFTQYVVSYITRTREILNAYSDGLQIIPSNGGTLNLVVQSDDIQKKLSKSYQLAHSAVIGIAQLKNGLDSQMRGAIKEMAQNYVRSLGSLREDTFVLLRRFASADQYYNDVNRMLDGNFQKVASSIKPEKDKVYEFLGLTPSQAKKMSNKEILKAVDKKVKSVNASQSDKQFLQRQLEYLFGSPYSKQEYDAYVKGQSALAQLKISSAQQKALEDIFMEVATLKNAMSGLE